MTEHFAARLRLACFASGKSFTDVANALGIKQQAVSAWACGRQVPRLHHVAPLCAVLGVTADWLLRDAPPPTNDELRDMARRLIAS